MSAPTLPEEAAPPGMLLGGSLLRADSTESLGEQISASLPAWGGQGSPSKPWFWVRTTILADQCAFLAAQPPPRCCRTLTPTPGSSTLPAGSGTGHRWGLWGRGVWGRVLPSTLRGCHGVLQRGLARLLHLGCAEQMFKAPLNVSQASSISSRLAEMENQNCSFFSDSLSPDDSL